MLPLKRVYQGQKPMSLVLPSTLLRPTAVPLPRFRLRSLLAVPTSWDARRRARLHFATLDDRELADVGLTRDQQRIECAKPFWKL
jgi:uncharacterized protein YjiS (DUF1127 family)